MLYDKRTFPSFLRAMLDHRDKIAKQERVIHDIDPRRAKWGDRCRFEHAINKRHALYREIKQTLVALGENKWSAARLAFRFIYHGPTADAMKMQDSLARRKRCKCAMSH